MSNNLAVCKPFITPNVSTNDKCIRIYNGNKLAMQRFKKIAIHVYVVTPMLNQIAIENKSSVSPSKEPVWASSFIVHPFIFFSMWD